MATVPKKELLRALPSVDELLREARLRDARGSLSLEVLTDSVRDALVEARKGILSGELKAVKIDGLVTDALRRVEGAVRPLLKRVVNASGTILHTNIGRAVLCDEAVEAVRLPPGNINIEFDLYAAERGERDSRIKVDLDVDVA